MGSSFNITLIKLPIGNVMCVILFCNTEQYNSLFLIIYDTSIIIILDSQ